MLVSVSRRTGIPAFYSEWFIDIGKLKGDETISTREP